MRRGIAALVSGIALAGLLACENKSGGVQLQAVGESESSGHSEDKAHVTRPDPVIRGESPTSTASLLASLPPLDRETVIQFYGNYESVAFDFDNQDQWDWMARNGYPTPADILAADRLSAEELFNKHKAGDKKGGAFYIDRVIGGGAETLSSSQRSRLQAVADDIIYNGSPFSGYVYARYHREVNQDPLRSLAGLAWAGFLGDTRALDILPSAQMQLSASNDVPPVGYLLAFIAITNDAQGRKPETLQRRPPFPDGP